METIVQMKQDVKHYSGAYHFHLCIFELNTVNLLKMEILPVCKPMNNSVHLFNYSIYFFLEEIGQPFAKIFVT